MNRNKKWDRSRGSLFALAALGALWQLLSWALQSPALPGPVESMQAFFHGLGSDLPPHLLHSSFRVIMSLILGLLLAVPIGLWLGRKEAIDRYLGAIVYLVYPVPKIVFLPVVLALLGLGDLSKVFLITLTVFFQILVTSRDAARSVSRPVLYSIRSLGARDWDIYRHVILPACLPQIFTSMRISLGTAIAVLFITETFATQEGIGFYLMDMWSRVAYDRMFAGVIAMGLLSLVLYWVLDWIEHRLCPWEYL